MPTNRGRPKGSKTMTRTELRVNGEVVPRDDYRIIWKEQKELFDKRAKECSLLVLDRFMEVVNKSKSDIAVVQAGKEIFTRAWGMPESVVNHSGKVEHQHVHSYADTLRQLHAHLESENVIEATVVENERVDADAAD